MAQVPLNADLDIIAESDIQITVDKLTGDLDIIQKLDDEPNDVGGLTAAQLKAKFDEAGNIIKNYINETLVPEVLSEGAVENQRKANETQRQAAEAARVQAEQERASAETARGTAESGRAGAESGRASAEAGRVQAEAARVSAEAERGAAENGRETAETGRVFAETVRGTAEAGRAQAESARAQAETGRSSAESARVQAESARAGAEASRAAAESAREAAQAAFFQGVTASAVQLEQGAEPTAEAVPEGGSFQLRFGIPAGGPRGKDGPPGANGKSAYQYAVDGGYTGTEAEFQALMGSGPWLPLDGGEVLLPKKMFCDFLSAPGVIFSCPEGVCQAYDEAILFKKGLYIQNTQIKGLAAPTSLYDAANKLYVDKSAPRYITITPSDLAEKSCKKKFDNVNFLIHDFFIEPSWKTRDEIERCNIRCTECDGQVFFGKYEGWLTFVCDTVPTKDVGFFVFCNA